ncbi:MAG: hypothetical protein HYT78_13180 [Deltaproteobacteria bacterium]|nr:hypothetical protein [Deltaproteobacteria bacterium]
MSLSFWQVSFLIFAAAATLAIVLGIFLWIHAWLIKREREKFIQGTKD